MPSTVIYNRNTVGKKKELENVDNNGKSLHHSQ